jgi:hypothetical protein
MGSLFISIIRLDICHRICSKQQDATLRDICISTGCNKLGKAGSGITNVDPYMLPLPKWELRENDIQVTCVIFIHSSVALRPFVGPWPLFQFHNPIHNR